MSIKDILKDLSKPKTPEGSPIPCRGYEINTPDAHEYDCGYELSGPITCDECIVNGGPTDPRTGKRLRKRRKK